MGLMKELNDLNNIYLQMSEGSEEVKEDENKGYTVTAADKKGNTPAWQGYKAGKKNVKTGKPLYKAADHLKDEVEDNSPVDHYLDELKKSTLGSYVKKASQDLSDRRFDQGRSEKATYEPDEDDDKEEMKLRKREKGIKSAADKLTKEEIEILTKLVESGKFSKEEIARIVEGYQRNPEKGEAEERKRSKKVRGERTPMPPRGDKRREDFERWYAANVR